VLADFSYTYASSKQAQVGCFEGRWALGVRTGTWLRYQEPGAPSSEALSGVIELN